MLVYRLAIGLAQIVLPVLALFNAKLKAGVRGRAQTFSILEAQLQPSDRTLWFHCASLGEYEQGLPVFEAVRDLYPQHKIVLSFFSPSGYEIRKNSPIADVVVYLPLDTVANAQRFIKLVHPELSIFVKYDIWPNYIRALKDTRSHNILISAAFRPQQSFFNWYGGLMRDALRSFDHIFVQNEVSLGLLHRINYTSCSLSGDTRFDRVSNQLLQNNHLELIETFKADQLCIVVGSSWSEDIAVLAPFINRYSTLGFKVIIAPHELKPGPIAQLQADLKPQSLLYSQYSDQDLTEYQILIIDNIGLLSKIYAYADIAYVGGAMGKTGLHNILEPAVFGIPVIIGKHHKKFPEAQAMIENAGVISISDAQSLERELLPLIENKSLRAALGLKNKNYIQKNKGAVIQIMSYLRTLHVSKA